MSPSITKKINTHLEVELYFHIFIAKYNYFHAIEKKTTQLMSKGHFWIFTFLYDVITA
jgi:hypothetical protein